LIRLRWRVSRWCDACLNFVFLHFFSWPAPFEPGGHPGEPWPEAAYWSLSWDRSSWESGQTAAEILIAFKAGVDIFFFLIFSICFSESQLQKIKHLSIPPFPLQSSGLLTELICCDLFLVLGFLLHSHASTKNGFLNICYFWYMWSSWSSSIFFGNKIGRSFHAASRYLFFVVLITPFQESDEQKKKKKRGKKGGGISIT
jgi:hypothetical protein